MAGKAPLGSALQRRGGATSRSRRLRGRLSLQSAAFALAATCAATSSAWAVFRTAAKPALSRGLGQVQLRRGHGTTARGATSAGVEDAATTETSVPAPDGGWPSLSVVVIGTEISAQQAVAKLGAQDYPEDKVEEVLILGECKNQKLSGALASKARSLGAAASLADALAGCSGEMVALWGDDHVSVPDRLRRQVAKVVASKSVSALRFDWFFTPAGAQFSKPCPRIDDGAEAFSATAPEGFEATDIEQNMSMPEGFLESAPDMDPKTMCGPRALLAGAASKATKAFMMGSDASERDVDDEIFLAMSQLPTVPSVPQGVEWVAARAPPPGMDVEAKAEGPGPSLVDAARAAFPAPAGSTTSPLDALRADPSVDAFVKSLLGMDMSLLRQLSTTQVRTAMQEHIEGCRGDDLADAVATLTAWSGVLPNKARRADVKRAPYFVSATSAIREHLRSKAEDMHYTSLGPLAENVVKFCLGFFAADGIVLDEFMNAMSMDPYYRAPRAKVNLAEGKNATEDIANAYVRALGFMEPLEAIGDAARFNAEDLPITGHASIAWAFSQADIKDPGLADAMAKAAARDKDTVGPQEVGKLFVALGEKHWVRDAEAASYVLKALVARVQELKRADPNLANVIERNAQQQ